jgi:hypothetical protein
MAIEDQLPQEEKAAPADPQAQDTRLSEDEEHDLKIAVLMAQDLIDKDGIKIIDQAVEESKDPGQVIGQFLMQMVSQMNEQLPEDVQLSKRIYFAHGGWIEQISDYLQDEYQIPKKIMDRAEMYIASTAKQMSQGAAQQANGGAAPAGAAGAQPGPEAMPPMPQPGAQ